MFDPAADRFPVDLTALALLVAACSFCAATALASDAQALDRWALVVAAGASGGTAPRLLARPVADRERVGFGFGLVAAVTGSILFGSAFLLGTPTDPVRAGVVLRAVGTLSLGALVVATVATVTYLVGVLRRRESPERRAERIAEQVIGHERR
ncbi:hypothetical protein ACFPYI_16185 [Halomarina salina]|uniref:Uncharacterized protein n=1 Tax=Halomarina salina TaxID=1872699 RepID=A0ABD5RQW0_9EURY|nr:hypothetical protein [Halomarina salina]